MAQVASSFKCLICNETLKFPNDAGIVDFTISFLQFYKEHDRCETLKRKLEDQRLADQKPTPEELADFVEDVSLGKDIEKHKAAEIAETMKEKTTIMGRRSRKNR
jgi:hypothetical protein